MNWFASNKQRDDQQNKLREQIIQIIQGTEYSLVFLEIDNEHFGNAIVVINTKQTETTYRFIYDRGDVYVELKDQDNNWKSVYTQPYEDYADSNTYAALLAKIKSTTHF